MHLPIRYNYMGLDSFYSAMLICTISIYIMFDQSCHWRRSQPLFLHWQKSFISFITTQLLINKTIRWETFHQQNVPRDLFFNEICWVTIYFHFLPKHVTEECFVLCIAKKWDSTACIIWTTWREWDINSDSIFSTRQSVWTSSVGKWISLASYLFLYSGVPCDEIKFWH